MSNSRALPPPTEPVVVLTRDHAEAALAASRLSDRRRMILPFHKGDAAPLHRMLNALQPGTYVTPHRHLTVPKAELFVVLRGAVDALVFDERGALTLVARLTAGGEAFGIDIEAGNFHSFLVRAPDTLMYEVKEGPYSPLDDKDFAPWAPREGAPGAAAYLAELEVRVERYRGSREMAPDGAPKSTD
ncbi:MAG: WbuC family cupin fold metalloprotein [Polyangiales bacterium]